jgi:hypothetical protein
MRLSSGICQSSQNCVKWRRPAAYDDLVLGAKPLRAVASAWSRRDGANSWHARALEESA